MHPTSVSSLATMMGTAIAQPAASVGMVVSLKLMFKAGSGSCVGSKLSP